MFFADNLFDKIFKTEKMKNEQNNEVPCQKCNEYKYTINNPYYIPHCDVCKYINRSGGNNAKKDR